MVCCQSTTLLYFGVTTFLTILFSKNYSFRHHEKCILQSISPPQIIKKRGKTARGFAKLRRIIYIENKNQMIKDMDIPKMIKKVDYSEYEGRYDESVNDVLTTSPDNLSVESMREYLYGYTFTEDYAKGEFPDEMSMDYWRDSDKGICDFEVDLPCYDRNNMPNDVWDTKGDEAFEVIDDILDDSMDEIDSIFDDNYCIDTLQERKILEAIDSTGDGISEETALCVTDVGQEYFLTIFSKWQDRGLGTVLTV